MHGEQGLAVCLQEVGDSRLLAHVKSMDDDVRISRR